MENYNTIVSAFMVFLNQLVRERRKRLMMKIFRRRRQTVSRIRNQMLLNYQLLQSELVASHISRAVFPPRVKRCWTKLRHSHFWETITFMEDQEFLENFRVTRSTFNIICRELYDELKPDSNQIIRVPVSVEKKVAIALYKMGGCCEYKVVGNVFGVHKSTVHKCLYQFVDAVNKILRPRYIQIPDVLEAEEIARRIEDKTGMVRVYGAIDGTHIPMSPPKNEYRAFLNRKGWPSMVLQCVVDDLYRFRDISIKCPGATPDSVVFRDSDLFKRAELLLPSSQIEIDGKLFPLMLVADSAYPLLPWLLTPYTADGVSNTQEEESFDRHLNSSRRIIAENAICRLKARWRCLLKRVDVKHTFVPDLVTACCVLHNIVETNEDVFLARWTEAVREAEGLFPQPDTAPIRNTTLESAKAIRDHLKEYLYKNIET